MTLFIMIQKISAKALALAISLCAGHSFAVTSSINSGPSSTTTTYAPSISAGTNTNITTYSNSFRWIYTLHTFKVCQSGAYSATSNTTTVVNTTFFLKDTYTPTAVFPPVTPIANFLVSNFSGGNTSTFPAFNLVAGQQYSVLVAYNQTTAGTYPYINTLTMDGPGKVIFNESGNCTPAAVPTLSEWAKILLSLSLLGFAGWNFRRYS
jgi:hypothetical protein